MLLEIFEVLSKFDHWYNSSTQILAVRAVLRLIGN